MKKQIVFLMSVLLMVACIFIGGVNAEAKVKKPGKVSSLSVERVSKGGVKLQWEKASNAKGYRVYMKTNKGKFKLVKTTKKSSLTKKGLKLGSTYYFKVKAYNKSKGKTSNGKFSSTRKITMKKSVYLVDVIEPYAKKGYEIHSGADTLEMCGNQYYNSFVIEKSNWQDDAFAIYNFNGEYSKMEFTIAALTDDDIDLLIYCDDEQTKIINVGAYDLPKTYIIDLKDVYKFELRYSASGWAKRLGFGNVKLYY